VYASEPLTAASSIDYANRGIWDIYYNAEDASGNKAEQVVFQIMLKDDDAPAFTFPYNFPTTIESCDMDVTGQQTDRRHWQMDYVHVQAIDAIDGDVSASIQVHMRPPGSNVVTQSWNLGESPSILVDTYEIGSWEFEYVADDKAGMFGASAVNNVMTLQKALVVQDTTPPHIFCRRQSKQKVHVGEWTGTTGLIDTYPAVTQLADCQDLCFSDGGWKQITGSASRSLCAYFQWASDESTCKLFDQTVKASFDQAQALAVGALPSTGTFRGENVGCEEQNEAECGTSYIDPGVVCVDMRDSWQVGGAVSASALTAVAVVQITDPTHRIVTYNCTDSSNNKVSRVREVLMADTTPPMINKLPVDGQEPQHLYQLTDIVSVHEVFVAELRAAFNCSDTCDGDITETSQLTATLYEDNCEGVYTCSDGNGGLTTCDGGTGNAILSTNTLSVGQYGMLFQCQDSTGNSMATCVSLHIESSGQPPSAVPTVSPTLGHCFDGQLNEDETDVDCGGVDCSRCTVGDACAVDTDCAAPLLCTEFQCSTPTAAPTPAPTGAPSPVPTAAPTAAPTAVPTATPTQQPTPHPCEDGSHGCDVTSGAGICYKRAGAAAGDHLWDCACMDGYYCAGGCDDPYTAHSLKR